LLDGYSSADMVSWEFIYCRKFLIHQIYQHIYYVSVVLASISSPVHIQHKKDAIK